MKYNLQEVLEKASNFQVADILSTTTSKLIQVLKDTPIATVVDFGYGDREAVKLNTGGWEVDGHKDITNEELARLIFDQRWVNLKEGLTKEDWRIIHKVEEYFGTYDIPPKGKTFIMPDGKFLNMDRCSSHSNIEQWLINNGLSKLKYAYLDDGSPTLSKLGCFRCNPMRSYCILPAVEHPTQETFSSLLLWLDYIFSSHQYVDIVGHDTKQKRYYFEKFSPDDIVDRVNAYYIHHELFENEILITRHFNKNYLRGPVGSELLLEEIDPRLIEEANEKVRNILKEHGVMSVKERLTEDVLRDRIKAQIERLEKNDLLVYDVTAGFGFNKLLVKINNLHPEYYTIWNENDEGEVANLIKYSSLENVIDWIIKDATSYTPKLLKNKYIKMEEDWEFDNMDIIKYIDLYVCMERFDNSIEENEFLAGAKEALDEEINSNLEYVKVTLGDVNGEVAIVPIFEEVNSIPGLEGVPANEFLENSFDRDYLDGMSFYVIDEAHRIRHTILGEISTINADLKKFADQWGFEKAANKRSTPMAEGLGYAYVDKRGNEKVDLEYNDLHVEFNYGPMDWDTGVGTEEFDQDIDYTYTVDKDDISEFLVDLDDLYETDKEFAAFIDADDYDGYYGYIDQHFDELVEKYYDKILEHFRDNAEREAAKEIDPEDYISYPDYDDWGD